jgi:hypothetical protein
MRHKNKLARINQRFLVLCVYVGSCEYKQSCVSSTIVSTFAWNKLQRLFPSNKAQEWVHIILLAHLALNVASVTYAHLLSGDHEFTATSS